MFTNTGIFTPITHSHTFTSFKGQQISIFSQNQQTVISSENLKYPLQDLKLQYWWMGTLNESIGDSFHVQFTKGDVIVYQVY